MTCGPRLSNDLRTSGFRVTPQRGVILETIAHLEGHPSAQEVFEAARRRLPGLNIATVYRTLDTLREAGLVDLLVASDELVRCSIHDPRSLHGHLICRNCHAVLEIGTPTLRSLADEVARREGFAIDISHLALTGLCETCQKNPTSSRRC
ncbi:MAG: Fur family transcriptional regulator [Chloroflexota bacterium]